MKVIQAKALPGYRLNLTFDSNDNGIVDLSSYVGRGVFASWNTPGVFDQVAVTSEGAVEWPGEIDLCPDSLYLQMTGKRIEEVFPALSHRVAHA
jgi:hypothetical protein